MSRFDYVKYDKVTTAKQLKFKEAAQKVEACLGDLFEAVDIFDGLIQAELDSAADAEYHIWTAREELEYVAPPKDAMQRLEQAYMWCGKALRDEQIARNGSAVSQEERTDS